jgi:hypothetical protein
MQGAHVQRGECLTGRIRKATDWGRLWKCRGSLETAKAESHAGLVVHARSRGGCGSRVCGVCAEALWVVSARQGFLFRNGCGCIRVFVQRGCAIWLVVWVGCARLQNWQHRTLLACLVAAAVR